MSPSILTQTLLGALLDSPAVVELASQAGKTGLALVKEHFTFTAFEITSAYQDGYDYALTAIRLGIAMPDQKLAFAHKIAHSKITREFAEQIDGQYLQPFAAQHFAADAQDNLASEFRQPAIKSLKTFAKHTDKLFEIRAITEEDLAALISYRNTLAITDTVLEQMQRIAPIDDTLAAFLRYEELLGNAILFFFRELLRKDERQRLQKTQMALQQEGLCIEMQTLQTTIQTAQQDLAKAAAEQSTQLVEIAQHLQQLQQTQLVWQTNHQSLSRFAQRFENRTAEILAWAKEVYTTLDKIESKLDETQETAKETQEEVKESKDLILEILHKINQLMAPHGLSSQVSPRDEFIQFDSNSLQFIQTVAKQLTQLPTQHPQYCQLSLKVGSALSSTGELAQAEQLFNQAIEKAQNSDDKALAYFNLFQIRWRKAYTATTVAAKQEIYAEALSALQAAIELSKGRYALHNINKGYYPIEQFLGAGGMGCALLCQNHNILTKEEYPKVVVKCFWENVGDEDTPLDKVFKEPLAMHKIAADSVPKALDFDYADNVNKQRPYFVTEYIEGAIDGEAWLEEEGPLDLEAGLQVALQIAEGLQRAHDKGICHFDLKPANLLLLKKPAAVGEGKVSVSVKIIDFGLARVTTSLREVASLRSRSSGLSQFEQAIFGTLEYAPPEQQGFSLYGKPSAKSDLFAFGATMYRLWTCHSPRHFRKRDLPNVSALRDLLFECVADDPKDRPESAKQLVERLKAIINAQKAAQRQIEEAQLRKEQQAKREAEEKRDETAWQTAQEQDTLSAYQTYLDGNTLKKHADEAQQRITACDESAWQTAQEQDTLSAYQTYLDGNTLKKHTDEAQQRITALAHKTFAFEVVTVNVSGEIINTETHRARHEIKDLGDGVMLEMVRIPEGTFIMGSPENERRYDDEGPEHRVTIKPFWMGKYPITQAQWQAIMGNNPSYHKGENLPVENISWDDAKEFFKRLSEKTGIQFQFPTEAQWEYACRAGTTTPFYFGPTITTDLANYDGNYTYASEPKGIYRQKTTEVGIFLPNAFGLYDMHGNVWEWCADNWHDNYNGAPTDGSVWQEAKEGGGRLLRGGSFFFFPDDCRSAFRYRCSSDYRDVRIGVRAAAAAWT